MRDTKMPLERSYNLSSLGRAGDEVTIAADRETLAKLARWAGVREVSSFEAKIDLRRLSATRFGFDADLKVDIIQDCVVSLEPVATLLRRQIHREMHLTEHIAHAESKDVIVEAESGADDAKEEISDLRYDLAKPLLEELILMIDPYPRAPGVAFVPAATPAADRPNPFAVLKNLKKQG